MQVIKQMILM